MLVSAREHKGQGRGIVQELAADVHDVVILMQQSIATLRLDNMCMCNRKVI